jgi:hypothetical protein
MRHIKRKLLYMLKPVTKAKLQKVIEDTVNRVRPLHL